MGNKPAQQSILSQPTPELSDEEILNIWQGNRLTDYGRITEQFLRDNWFQISNSKLLMASLSRDFKRYNSLTESFLEEYITSPWNWNKLTKSISLIFVEKHPELDWDWNLLSTCEDIEDDFLQKFSNKPLNWFSLSVSRCVYTGETRNRYYSYQASISFISKHPEFEWDWSRISSRSDATMEFLTTFSEKPFDWSVISNKKDLTPEFIHRFQHKLDLNDNISHILDEFVEKKEKDRLMKQKLMKTAELLGIFTPEGGTQVEPSAPVEGVQYSKTEVSTDAVETVEGK